MIEPSRPQHNKAHTLCMLDNEDYTHTHTHTHTHSECVIYSTNGYSTATMFARKRLNVTLNLLCLYCSKGTCDNNLQKHRKDGINMYLICHIIWSAG